MIIRALKRVNIEWLMKLLMPIGSWYLRKSPRMITCREFNEFIFDYTENLLSDKQLTLFNSHMKVCPMCRNFLKTYIAAYKAGKAFFPLSDESVPSSVPEDLLEAIRDVSSD
jgi:hypothetical protein